MIRGNRQKCLFPLFIYSRGRKVTESRGLKGEHKLYDKVLVASKHEKNSKNANPRYGTIGIIIKLTKNNKAVVEFKNGHKGLYWLYMLRILKRDAITKKKFSFKVKQKDIVRGINVQWI